MRILFSFVFSSLFCTQLLAMDVPRDPKEPSTVSQLQDLFANPQLLFDSQTMPECEKLWVPNTIEEVKWDPQGRFLACVTRHAAPSIVDSYNGSVHTLPIDNLSPWVLPQLAWNTSGNLLALGLLKQKAFHSSIVIYDVANNRITRQFNTGGYGGPPAVAWSPHEKNRLAVLESPYRPVRFYHIPKDPSEPVKHTDPPVEYYGPSHLKFPKFDTRGSYHSGESTYGTPMHLDWRHNMLAMAYVRAVFCMNTKTEKLGSIMSGAESGTYPCPEITCHPQKNIIAVGGIPGWRGNGLERCNFGVENRCRRLELHQIDEASEPTLLVTKELDWWKANLRSLSFSHDGKFLIAAYDDGLSIRDGETLEELSKEHPESSKHRVAQWNPKEERLAFTVGTKLYITQARDKDKIKRFQDSCKDLKSLDK